jgi:hypothetical protein
MSDKVCADSSRTVAGPGSDDSTFRDRLANARSPEEAASILGKRRLIGYAFGFAAVAIGCLAASVYVIVEVATGQESAWTLAALPALVSLVLFSGVIGSGLAYFVATDRRWPKAEVIERIAGRLNSNIYRR